MSTSTRPIDKLISQWATEWRQEHLSPEINKLIKMANYDLHFGPPEYEDECPDFAFGKACTQIKEVLQDIPSVLYFDENGGCWQADEPECQACPTCNDPDYELVEGACCDTCDDTGYLEPMWEDYYKVERAELKRELVGKELCAYV